jgi:RNA polymerase sigma-70 factor (ECF subfamily)
MSDDSLVQRARSAPTGDTRAFETLVKRHQEKILANCRFLTGSADDAQDLAQEVFIKAFFGLKRFEGRSAFGSWVQRIKVNHCLNFIRKRKGKSFVDVDDPLTEVEPELHVAAKAEKQVKAQDERDRIRQVLDQLPETLRLPLLMRDLDGMSYQEIAEILKIGLSAVKMRIKRGREEFRRLYGPTQQNEQQSQQVNQQQGQHLNQQFSQEENQQQAGDHE